MKRGSCTAVGQRGVQSVCNGICWQRGSNLGQRGCSEHGGIAATHDSTMPCLCCATQPTCQHSPRLAQSAHSIADLLRQWVVRSQRDSRERYHTSRQHQRAAAVSTTSAQQQPAAVHEHSHVTGWRASICGSSAGACPAAPAAAAKPPTRLHRAARSCCSPALQWQHLCHALAVWPAVQAGRASSSGGGVQPWLCAALLNFMARHQSLAHSAPHNLAGHPPCCTVAAAPRWAGS